MINRVTQNQISSLANSQLAKQTSELFKRQQEISTGLRIQRPSDDPAAMRRSLVQKDRLDRLDSHLSSIQFAQSRLSQSEVQLQDANTLLVRARGIALQAPQATDETEVKALANELDGILNQLTNVANAKDENGYLFSGTASQTQPFPANATRNGQSSYAGSQAGNELLITGDTSRDTVLSGDQIFQPIARESTILTGKTGAKAGTGMDTATGTRELLVTHVATSYAGTSGVTAGTNSATGDTIIGALGTHRLQINDTSGTGAAGTLSLNGGPAVNFTNGDTNLLVQGPGGEQISIDASAITAGFNGSVDIASTGAMSIDGGLTTIPITFAANEVVTDSRDGTIVNVDSTAIAQSGTGQMEFPGTVDVFNAVRALRNDLLNTRNLSSSDRTAALSRRLADIDRVHNHLLDTIGVQSVSQQQIDGLQSRTEELQLAGNQQYSDTVSADIFESVTRLQELTNLQQFTMSAVGKLLTPNLLNYIQ